MKEIISIFFNGVFAIMLAFIIYKFAKQDIALGLAGIVFYLEFSKIGDKK